MSETRVLPGFGKGTALAVAEKFSEAGSAMDERRFSVACVIM